MATSAITAAAKKYATDYIKNNYKSWLKKLAKKVAKKLMKKYMGQEGAAAELARIKQEDQDLLYKGSGAVDIHSMTDAEFREQLKKDKAAMRAEFEADREETRAKIRKLRDNQ